MKREASTLDVQWMPIYLEPQEYPQMHYGTVVGILADNGQAEVVSIVPDRIIQAILDGRAENVATVIEFIVDSLSEHLQRWQSFQGWSPPFATTVVCGRVQVLRASSMDKAIERAASLAQGMAPAANRQLRLQ